MTGKSDSAWSAVLGDDEGNDIQDVPTVKISASHGLIASIRNAVKGKSNKQQPAVDSKKKESPQKQMLAVQSEGKDRLSMSSDASTIKLSKIQLQSQIQSVQSVPVSNELQSNQTELKPVDNIMSDLEEFLGFDDDDEINNGAFSADMNPSKISPLKQNKQTEQFDDDLMELSAMSAESDAIRKPLQLDSPTAENSIKRSNDLGSVSSGLSQLSISKSEKSSDNRKSGLSVKQLDDLESFLNDDESQPAHRKVTSAFGSFLPSDISAVRKEKLIAPQIKVPQNLTEFDCSYGQQLPVSNWGNVIKANSKTLLFASFSQNALQKIPDINCAENLVELDLSYNKLNELPNIENLKQLQTLNVRCNLLNKIESFNLVSLKNLYMFGNQLISLDGISKFKTIVELDLSFNKIKTLSKELSQLTQLQRLNLASNQIQDIDESIFHSLKDLRVLNVSKNLLQSLPKSINNLENLEELDVSDNKHLTNISNIDFKKLQKIRLVNFQNTQIKSIPQVLSENQNILLLNLRNTLIQQQVYSKNEKNKAHVVF